MLVEFVGVSNRRGANPKIQTERLVNVEPEPIDGEGRALYQLRAAQGYAATELADLELPARATIFHNDLIYVVAGGTLFSVAEDGTETLIGAIPDDLATTMASLGDDLAIAAGGRRFNWDGTSLTNPDDGAFSGAGSVTSNDDRIIASEPDGQQFDWSNLLDAETIDALNFARKGSKPDELLRVIATNEDVWLMGASSSEIYYTVSNPSNSSEVYDRVPGAVIETGIISRGLAVNFHDELFFVGSDKKIHIAVGTQMAEISRGAQRDAISAEAPERIFAYEADGNRFIVVWFRNSPAWIFKKDVGIWFERSTGVRFGPWEVIDTVKAWNNEWYALTIGGQLRKMERVYADGAQAQRRTMVSIPIDASAEKFRIKSVEIRLRSGDPGLTREARISFRYTKDGGNNWSKWRIEDVGDVGEFATRNIMRGLGSFRNFSFEISVTDPIPLFVESACIIKFNDGR